MLPQTTMQVLFNRAFTHSLSQSRSQHHFLNWPWRFKQIGRGLCKTMVLPEQRPDSVREEAIKLEPLLDWAILERQWVFHWNTYTQLKFKKKLLKITSAAPISDMLERITLNAKPPIITVPQKLPAKLPNLKSKQSIPKYPAVPTGRLGIGVLVAADYPSEKWPDIICEASFIHVSRVNQYIHANT